LALVEKASGWRCRFSRPAPRHLRSLLNVHAGIAAAGLPEIPRLASAHKKNSTRGLMS
jgi:hypothetical protein